MNHILYRDYLIRKDMLMLNLLFNNDILLIKSDLK